MIANTVSRMLTQHTPPGAPTVAPIPTEEVAPPQPWRNLAPILTMQGASGARVLVITAHDHALMRHSVTVAFRPDEPIWRVTVLVEPVPPQRDQRRFLSVLDSALLTCWRHHEAERGIHPLRSALFGQAASRLAAYIADTREAARTDDGPTADQDAADALAGDATRANR